MTSPADPDARELTPLDALLSEDERRLAVALGCDQPRPWPETPADDLAWTLQKLEAEAAARAPQ